MASEVTLGAGVDCTTAGLVEAGASSAAGKSFTDDYFTCTPVKEGPGSTWAKFWKGTYYDYTCSSAAAGQSMAFNWGTGYSG